MNWAEVEALHVNNVNSPLIHIPYTEYSLPEINSCKIYGEFSLIDNLLIYSIVSTDVDRGNFMINSGFKWLEIILLHINK